MNTITKEFIQKLPKAELHVHTEGTMEPEQLLLFAERNKIKLPYKTVEQARKVYQCSDYESFVNAYIQASIVLQKEQDFYDLILAYLKKVSEQGVLHAEIFFDFQTYIPRNIHPAVIVNGIHQALTDGEKLFGISGRMLLCFIRHLSQEDAFKALELSLPFREKITGVGLASLEKDNPPSKFQQVFAKARSYGYHAVAHVSENKDNAATIRQALQLLHIERIDHGIGCMGDPSLVRELARTRIPFTVCPFSNVVLNIVKNLENHPLKAMIDAGLMVTINSDDPAFFGGYIADNYYAAATTLELSVTDIINCARNSFIGSFADEERKQKCLATLDAYVKKH